VSFISNRAEEIPISKHQITNKSQTPNFKDLYHWRLIHYLIIIWICDLVFPPPLAKEQQKEDGRSFNGLQSSH